MKNKQLNESIEAVIYSLLAIMILLAVLKLGEWEREVQQRDKSEWCQKARHGYGLSSPDEFIKKCGDRHA